MKDIDFDELDKAVSSVLSQGKAPIAAAEKKETATETAAPVAPAQDEAPAEAATPAAGGEPTQDAPLSAPADAKEAEPAVIESEPAAHTAVEPSAPAPVAPVVTPPRKAGRFMDVVHPSSDMAGPKAAVAPTKRVSMAGRTLQPLEPIAAPVVEPTPEAPSHPAPAEGEPASAPAEEPAWPDPIEVAEAPAAVPVQTPSVPLEEAGSDPVAAATVPAFLPDAKVEKRPLGAFTAEAPAADAPAFDNDLQGPVATPQTEALPPELEPDIVSVEADVDKLDVEAGDDQSVKGAHAAAAAPQAATINGTLSIPKQYQEAEREPAPGTHALFDTKEYHPPLTVHGEGGHRFLWLWMIVAAVLLLGTAGIFAYWYMQNL